MKKIANYFKRYNTQITFLVFLAVLLFFAQNVPYVNLFIDPVWYEMLFIICASILLRFSSGKLIILAMIFLIISLPWVLVGSRVAGENFGVLCFTSFALAIIKELLVLRKK